MPHPQPISYKAATAGELVAHIWPEARVEDEVSLAGDASSRSYARLRLAAGGAPTACIVMYLQDAAVAISTEELGGPVGPGQGGETAFENVARFLDSISDTAPRIYGVAEDRSLMLLEDVGDTPLWEACARPGPSAESWFARALDLLVALQEGAAAAPQATQRDCLAYAHAFDEKLFGWEFDHFIEFGVDRASAGEPLLRKAGAELRALAARLAGYPRVFCHRDYHAWNIHVYQDRLRVIDFQDALMAPALYDVASLLTDRNTPERIDANTEHRLFSRYFESAIKHGVLKLSRDEAGRVFELCALHRSLKVVGRFNYLAEVKDKRGYLAFLPFTIATAKRFAARVSGIAAVNSLLAEHVKCPSVNR